MTKQPVLNVLLLQWLTDIHVVLQINHCRGQVICCPSGFDQIRNSLLVLIGQKRVHVELNSEMLSVQWWGDGDQRTGRLRPRVVGVFGQLRLVSCIDILLRCSGDWCHGAE